jgi:hypothetical protein
MGMGSELMCESGDWRLWDGGVKNNTQTLNIKRFFYTTQRFSQVLLSWNLFSSLHPTGWLSSKQSWQASVSTPATHTNQPTTSPTPLHPQTAQTIHSSPSPTPKQFPFSSSISKPITKTTPFLAPQLAHTVCCTPQSRLRATLLHVAREASLSLTSGDSLAADALIRWFVRCGLLPVGRMDEYGWVVRWAGFKDGGWGLARRISGRGGSGGRMGDGFFGGTAEDD